MEAGGQAAKDSARFRIPHQVVNPKNNFMAAIGNKFIQSNSNYEDVLKQAMGPQNFDNQIEWEQLMTAIRNGLNIKLTIDEQNVLQEWFRLSMNNQRKVEVIRFLLDIGLPSQTITTR